MLLRKLLLVPTMILALSTSVSALAKDFSLPVLKQAKNPTFDLKDVAGEQSYFDFMTATLTPKIQEQSSRRTRDNEAELKGGRGISVKLSENNYNIHINFPNAAEGGRSYGWTSGQVGDWSDKMYLDHLAGIMNGIEARELTNFYSLVIQMLGACNADGESLSIENLEFDTQRVASNFLAIYTAEQYRAMVPDPHKNWDDALLEVTLLGAFHGGQSTFTKYYLGKFTTASKKQGSGVYARGRPGPNAEGAEDKEAEMNDYWQFSANPTSKQSGINLTRLDFEKMGSAITKYEETVAENRNLTKIRAIVGDGESNVIKAISKFFTQGKSVSPAKINELAKAVSAFLLSVHKDADKITTWIEEGNADD